jgi:peptidoglycan/LPS O-acetylase OafA/YrhL
VSLRTALTPAQSDALDGLRGLAALIVVASHASGLGLPLLPGWSFAGMGKYGVYLFFVISAFLLTLQWLELPAQERMRFAPSYFWRRVLRIYPLYALVLLADAALARFGGLGVRLDGAGVLGHLLLREGRSIYWSVPVEFKYYLLLPVVALWLARERPSAPWRVAALGVCLLMVQLAYPSEAVIDGSLRLLDYLPVFIAGSLAAFAFQWSSAAEPAPRPAQARPQVVLLQVGLALVLLLAMPGSRKVLHGPGTEALHRAFFAWGVYWSVVLMAVLTGRAPQWARLLRSAGLRACGRWCFGLYLLHVPALYFARRLPMPAPVNAWVGLAIALALAALAHAWVERPAMRWGRRLSSRAVSPAT